MHDNTGNTAHQQHAQHEEIVDILTQQQPDNRPHYHPVSTGYRHLSEGKFPGGQYQFLALDGNVAMFREGAKPQINNNHQQQRNA